MRNQGKPQDPKTPVQPGVGPNEVLAEGERSSLGAQTGHREMGCSGEDFGRGRLKWSNQFLKENADFSVQNKFHV